MCKQLSSYWQSGLTVLLQGAAKEWSCRAWNSGRPCAHTCLDAILCLLLWVSIVGIVRLVCTWSQERLSQGTYSLRYATGISHLLNSVWQKPTTVLSDGIEPQAISLSPSSFHFVLCCNLNCLEQSVFSVFGALWPECYTKFCWREKNMLD